MTSLELFHLKEYPFTLGLQNNTFSKDSFKIFSCDNEKTIRSPELTFYIQPAPDNSNLDSSKNIKLLDSSKNIEFLI